MPGKKIKTGWLRFGRSGDTIDGRQIDDGDLLEAAADYNPDFYTALIWYEHLRGFNMGKVLSLRAEKNEEGGVDLFGQFQPNDYYKMINSDEQKLFLSMELFRNFRKTGKTYLKGLAATDEPASVSTSEVRFSRVEDKDALLSEFIEGTPHSFSNEKDTNQETVPGWFSRILNNLTPEDDMDSKKLKALEEKFSQLHSDFHAKKAKQTADDNADSGSEGEPTADENYAALSDQVVALSEQIKTMESKISNADEELKLSQLESSFNELKAEFTAALKETGGTDAGEETGGADVADCL